MYTYVATYTHIYIYINTYNMCIYASMFIRQQGIHWSWWKPLSVTTKLRHWMTKGKPAISIPRAATSVQIRKRTSWTGSYEHIHGKLRFEYYDLNTQLGSALNKWRETWEIHAVVWEIEWDRSPQHIFWPLMGRRFATQKVASFPSSASLTANPSWS